MTRSAGIRPGSHSVARAAVRSTRAARARRIRTGMLREESPSASRRSTTRATTSSASGGRLAPTVTSGTVRPARRRKSRIAEAIDRRRDRVSPPLSSSTAKKLSASRTSNTLPASATRSHGIGRSPRIESPPKPFSMRSPGKGNPAGRTARSLPVRATQCAEARSPSLTRVVRVEQTTSRPAPANCASSEAGMASKGRACLSWSTRSVTTAGSSSAMGAGLFLLQPVDGDLHQSRVLPAQPGSGGPELRERLHPYVLRGQVCGHHAHHRARLGEEAGEEVHAPLHRGLGGPGLWPWLRLEVAKQDQELVAPRRGEELDQDLLRRSAEPATSRAGPEVDPLHPFAGEEQLQDAECPLEAGGLPFLEDVAQQPSQPGGGDAHPQRLPPEGAVPQARGELDAQRPLQRPAVERQSRHVAAKAIQGAEGAKAGHAAPGQADALEQERRRLGRREAI